MPALTIYLSRLVGVVALISGVAMLIDKRPPIAALGGLSQEPALLYVMGIIGIVAGVAIVLVHNIWRQGLPALLVTLLGWMLLIRGVVVVLLPPDLLSGLIDALHFAESPLVLGAYLSLKGFSPTAPRSGDRALAPTSSTTSQSQPAKVRPRRRR
jgi:hypothetical protein